MVGPSRWNSDRRLVGFPRLDIQMTRDIRATRDSLGLSTGGLAKLVGVGRRTAERWMAGTSDVPEPVWRLLAACRDPAVRAIIEAIAQGVPEWMTVTMDPKLLKVLKRPSGSHL
jgi:predicted transcriptional regulator